MDFKHNKELLPRARELRKNMTEEERHLWYVFLRNYPIRFLRQKTIGGYIVDFYCASAKLVIELDGQQHSTNAGAEYDKERDAFLAQYDLMVFRISNQELRTHFNEICAQIDQIVKERCKKSSSPHPPCLP